MMQQTEKYQLNLIEKTDTFSPDPLNENMEKVEAAITAEAAALDQRLQVFEAKHVAFGTYRATADLDFDLGFRPMCVIIQSIGSGYWNGMIVREYDHNGSKITENGFHIHAIYNSAIGKSDVTYGYLALD